MQRRLREVLRLETAQLAADALAHAPGVARVVELLPLLADLVDTKMYRAREARLAHHEVHRGVFLYLRSDQAPVGAERRERLQQSAPQQVFDALRDTLTGEKIRGPHIDNARAHIGALQQLAELDKAVGVIAAQGVAQHAVDDLYALDDLLQIGPAIAPAHGFLRRLGAVQVELVDEFPDFVGQHVAGDAHIGPRGLHGVGNAARRAGLADQQAQHILFAARLEPALEYRLRVQNAHENFPARLRAARDIHNQVVVGRHQARGVLGALDIARHPVHPLRNAREHAHRRPSTIQVSLLPPP